jgi:hypothetical protein
LSPDSGYSVLVVQHAQANGSNLTIYISLNADKANLGAIIQPPVTPSLVSEFIRQALQLGWPSTKRTLDFVCDLHTDRSLTHRD